MFVQLTNSQRMALVNILGEELARPHHTEVYFDVVKGVETKPEDLFVLFMDYNDAITPLLKKLRETFDAQTVAETKRFGGIPSKSGFQLDLETAIAELLNETMPREQPSP